MTDWSVSRKLDEVIEQNKEIINLMKMQMIVANPDVDFYDLEKKVKMAARESQDKALAEEMRNLARRNKEKHEREKRMRAQKLKEKNDDINHIINNHNQISGSTPWMPSFNEKE